ncbi:fasciclin domain-containing protein [Pedobacter sp. B4-66]|uniref:fasciclin domain-containing protein n=1 Tax=Pedobacter sp. B4-66 TaxID=2817280 RepID=UPI001BDA9D1B|nr:fasciclin domain-containing protein [Pedobacter sp. B4-66]
MINHLFSSKGGTCFAKNGTYKSFLALLFTVFIFSCKKDKQETGDNKSREPQQLINNITSKLSGADSIANFMQVLKDILLSKEEVSEGITVFAPLNDDVAITSAMVKDHIIKGSFNHYELYNKRIFTTLSGKELKISRSADTIWINGVQVGGKQIVYNDNEAVHTMKSSLTPTTTKDELHTTTIEVTVWDGTKWSIASPKGEVISGATVNLYATQHDYTDGAIAYSSKTNASGKATLKRLASGRYYIEAFYGNKTNTFRSSAEPYSGFYMGYAISGIFQSDAEVNAGAKQSNAAPGNFKWVDLNNDGIVDSRDYYGLPYESTVTISALTRKTEISIGFLNNKKP